MKALNAAAVLPLPVDQQRRHRFDADADSSDRTASSAFLLSDRCMLFTEMAGMHDFSAISRSCSSMMARAGASPSRPLRTSLGTLRLDRCRLINPEAQLLFDARRTTPP